MRTKWTAALAVWPAAFAFLAIAQFDARAGAPPVSPKDRDPFKKAPYAWETKGRSPFEFRPAVVTEPNGNGNGENGNGDEPPPQSTCRRHPEELVIGKCSRCQRGICQKDKDKFGSFCSIECKENRGTLDVRAFAERNAVLARYWLRKRQYAKTEELCTSALNKIESVDLDAPMLIERLERLLATARRLSERARIEQEFRDLRIIIDSIIWEPDRAVAAVNGSVVEAGDEVSGAKGVRVEEIWPDSVVFSLKGVRVRKGTTQ